MKIYLVTWPNGYFGSAPRAWNTLSVEKISASLRADGFDVEEVRIDKLLEKNIRQDDFVIYTSSEIKEMREYIKDVLYFVKDKATLVPSYDILLAHENKGFQELFRQKNGFGNLGGGYHFDLDEFPLEYPYVIKTVDGSGSIGVDLVKGDQQVSTIKRKYFSKSTKREVINLIRRYQLTKSEYKLYAYKNKAFKRLVYQKFVADLSCDYRVLKVGGKFYSMRRDLNKGDFRASGRKNFTFDDAPLPVLNLAKNVAEYLDSPYVSLDIVLTKENSCHLIEYQGTNFGSSALRCSKGYYHFENGDWKFVEAKSDLEIEFGKSFISYIRNKLAI